MILLLSESEKLEYQDWLDSLNDEGSYTYDPGKDYTFVPPRDVAYWVNLLDEEARVEREENERLLQMAQQAADDEEYFDAASAYEDRF